jgi:hypothetical protein
MMFPDHHLQTSTPRISTGMSMLGLIGGRIHMRSATRRVVTVTSQSVAQNIRDSGDAVPKPLGFIAGDQRHDKRMRRRCIAERQRRPCPWTVAALGLFPNRALSSPTARSAYPSGGLDARVGSRRIAPHFGWKASKGLWKSRHFRGR